MAGTFDYSAKGQTSQRRLRLREKRVYDTASMEETLVEGVLCLEIRGIVTAAVAVGLIPDIARAGMGQSAMLIDWTRAVVTASVEQMFAEVVTTITERGPMRLSMALVASSDNTPMLRTYARLMAARGLVRVVFPERAEAMAWAMRQRDLYDAEIRYQAQSARLLPRGPYRGSRSREGDYLEAQPRP